MNKLPLTLLAPVTLLVTASLPAVQWAPDLVLPLTSHAEREPGLMIEVDSEGRVHSDGDVRLRPGEDQKRLARWLAKKAGPMRTAPNAALGIKLPDERVLLRADASAPFHVVQTIMQNCAMPEAGLWRIELATRLTNGRGLGFIPVHLATDLGLPAEVGESAEEPTETALIRIDVLEVGERRSFVDPDEPWPGSGPSQYVGRTLQYRIGPAMDRDISSIAKRLGAIRKGLETQELTVDARAGVTYGEVVQVLDRALDSGFKEFHFSGYFD